MGARMQVVIPSKHDSDHGQYHQVGTCQLGDMLLRYATIIYYLEFQAGWLSKVVHAYLQCGWLEAPQG
jgi:hypothetical protein